MKFSAYDYKDYGKNVFTGDVADSFLKKHGASGDLLKDPSWPKTSADTVAAAVSDWAIANGAGEGFSYTHWHQPMGASNVRPGLTGQVHNKVINFDAKTNKVRVEFKGKNLIMGETDGSSFPNGGLRATHSAGGYLHIDTSSPIFLRGDTVFIPSVFASYHGAALCEKLPLLRSNAALDSEGKRLMSLLGSPTEEVFASIGLEQEIFFVPRADYLR